MKTEYEFRIAACRRTPSSRGFTLLEIMVAVAILSMVLITLLGLKNRSMEDVRMAEHLITATMLAKDLMTDLVISKPGPSEEEGGFSTEEMDYTWKRTVSSTQIASLMEIRVAVFWKQGTREETIELVSYE